MTVAELIYELKDLDKDKAVSMTVDGCHDGIGTVIDGKEYVLLAQ